MSTIKLPNFLIVGGQRCGTTYLWGLLRQHPEIFLSKEKEPQYFGELLQNADYPISEYEKHFYDVQNEIAIGESSVENMYLDGMVPLIAKVLGKIQFIFVLRNPIERAYSHYWMMVATRREFLSFENAIRAEGYRTQKNMDGLRKYSYLNRGLYFEQIRRFTDRFSPDQMLFIQSDDLYRRTDETLSYICRFLGVNEEFMFDKEIYKHHPPIPKNIVLFRFLNLITLTTKNKPGYWQFGPYLRRWQNYLLKQNQPYPAMRKQTRLNLQTYFKEANLELGEFLGKDLSHWK